MAKPADRLKRIEKEVCADLQCEPEDELCRHVSTLRLARENMQAKLLLGERVDIKDMLDMDAALKQYLPIGKPASITVEFVEGVKMIARCPRCGHNTSVDADKIAGNMRVNGEKIEVAPPKPATADTAAPAAPAPAPEPPKPAEPKVKGYREGVSASGFHAAVLSNGEVAPLKKMQRSPYDVSRNVSPMSHDGLADPKPIRDVPGGSARDESNPNRERKH